MPYLKSTQVYNCPSSNDTPYTNDSSFFPHYGINTDLFEHYGLYVGLSLSRITQPTSTVFMADSKAFPRVNPQGYTFPSNNYDYDECYPQYRHLETTVVGFADGHVKSMRKSALQVKSATEEGISLTGDDQFLLWNLS